MTDAALKVLIVDDDVLDRDVFKRYLEGSPEVRYVFDDAGSGREGLERCSVFNPDCVLLDYRLRDMDGVSFVHALQGPAGARYPIVMLTAIGNERVAVDAMKAGVMDYAVKGAAAAGALHHTIRNAVEKFRMQREIEGQRAA